MNREDALGLLNRYNDNISLIHHAYCVEAVMRYMAEKNGEDPEYWGLVGLLHDVDYGKWPDQHCKKAPELLKEIGADDAFIHAVVSHGWGLCSDIEPTSYMEKVLFTIDELTGLVYATALMRPEKMVGMSTKSVKKKWSSASFAAGVNRDVILKGIDMLANTTKEEIIDDVIKAMTPIASEIGL